MGNARFMSSTVESLYSPKRGTLSLDFEATRKNKYRGIRYRGLGFRFLGFII